MPPSGRNPLDVERIALAHVPGPGALVSERLGRGLVNETYRVARAGQRYSVRIPAPHAEDLGLDRAWECRVLCAAAAAGLAPPIEHCEPARGILVARWVDGAALTPAQVVDPAHIRAVALLARKVHALPIPRAPRCMDPARWVAHYSAALERRGRSPRRADLDAAMEARLAALAALPAAAVLCHSDLHVANLVAGTAGLTLLDWEYAHVADPFWDLAGWSCNNDFAPQSRRLLLASYLGREPAGPELARLDHLAWLYDYVCLLWSELYAVLAGTEGREVLARAQALAERLKWSSAVVGAGNFRHTTGL